MSEPMSSVEIEDVLSSIRRLVSDEHRPQARQQPAAPLAEPSPVPAADKLLLTPALRIVPDADSYTPEDAAPAIELAAQSPAFHSIRHAEPAEAAEPVPEAAFIAVEDDDVPEPSVVAAFAAAPGDSYDDDGAAAPLDIVVPEGAFDAAEAAEAPGVSQPEPEASVEDWADAAEAAVRAELEDDTITDAYAHFLDDAPEAGTIDEEALRELVREIIREELQGTLGERITRNVRKLVRAEVARALAVRDFE
ncbi:hypothetical protein [Paragemmobacter straminiformis]|uniref:Uncharacterized protein n=1 Tax=Paragemmobacter straminiformis TaxID=2045119 RepID=A0A842IAL7_9RHOB|nr:hypothetical protein [Gemmobacter straminiformis]MBC2836651.1 hypothetical protein [Gemmobacter straminiformis]